MRLTIFAIIMVLLLSVPRIGFCAPPANDDVENAESVGNVTDLVFDTTEATVDGPEAYMTGQNI